MFIKLDLLYLLQIYGIGQLKTRNSTLSRYIHMNSNTVYSLPLPDFELTGTMNIRSQSAMRTRTKLMSLPVEDRQLTIKVRMIYMTLVSFLHIYIPLIIQWNYHNIKRLTL